MKKVKIMLTVIALFAVVGGALAFKAKFTTKYCTAKVNTNGTCPATCPNILQGKTDVSGINFCYTPTTSLANCLGATPPACIVTPTLLTVEVEQ